MDPDEAAHVLGVPPGADPVVLRSAYRQLIRDRHPDHAGQDHTAAAARIIEAYTVLRRVAPVPAPPAAPAPPPPDDRSPVAPFGDDTLVVHGRADVVVRMLLDAAHDLGEVTYVDLGAGLVQLVVTFEGGPVCLFLLTLHRRAGHVEVHLAVDSLDARPAPPIGAVMALLVDVVRQRAWIDPADR
jgi:hypothetical protein